jgi:hypothetical protein
LDPERAVILLPRFDEKATLPDPGAATLDVQAHALFPILEIGGCDLHSAAIRERFPVGLEVLAFEPAAANLFGEQPIFHRMVDVLQELAVDPLVNGSRDSFRIDEQDCDPRLPRCRGGFRNQRARHDERQGAGGGGRHRTHEKVASIHPKFELWFRLVISTYPGFVRSPDAAA